jgi:hypothetical protein
LFLSSLCNAPTDFSKLVGVFFAHLTGTVHSSSVRTEVDITNYPEAVYIAKTDFWPFYSKNHDVYAIMAEYMVVAVSVFNQGLLCSFSKALEKML